MNEGERDFLDCVELAALWTLVGRVCLLYLGPTPDIQCMTFLNDEYLMDRAKATTGLRAAAANEKICWNRGLINWQSTGSYWEHVAGVLCLITSMAFMQYASERERLARRPTFQEVLGLPAWPAAVEQVPQLPE
jgi:hypothetical protein